MANVDSVGGYMKVALISHEGGGISSVSYGLGKSLARKGIDTTIFTGVDISAPRTERLNDHLEVTYLPRPDFAPRNLWFQAINIKRLLELLKDYTIVHGVSPHASFALTFFKRRLAKPFVATIHECHRTSQRAFVNQPTTSWTLRDLGFFILEFPLHDFSVRRVLDSSDQAAFCSFTLLRQVGAYIHLDRDKTSVVYNGINFDEIENAEEHQTESRDDIKIIFAGRLYWLKGVMLLLEAFNRIKNDIKNARLQIFGKGPLQQKINKFIADSDLKARVSFQGYVPHRRLLTEIKKSDIVAYPSLSEAQPMFMLEAMACKKPLLAFDVPFSREIISDMENGVLARAGDIEDLSKKIHLLVHDEKLRRAIGEAAYDHVKRNHNWEKQADNYLKLYERALSHK